MMWDDGLRERDDRYTDEPHSSDIVVEYDMNESHSSDMSDWVDPSYHPSYSSEEDEKLLEVA